MNKGVTTWEEMYEAICHMAAYANREGLVLDRITIMAQYAHLVPPGADRVRTAYNDVYLLVQPSQPE